MKSSLLRKIVTGAITASLMLGICSTLPTVVYAKGNSDSITATIYEADKDSKYEISSMEKSRKLQ